MPDLLGQIKRKAAHRKKEKLKLTYHIIVYSITGAPRNLQAAAFTIERGDHAFESTTATQSDGSFFWNERISQLVTLYRNEDGSLEEKEYTLKLWAMTQTPKGDKRGDVFGRAKLNLSKYAAATTGKRVVLTITPEGAASAQDKGRNITVVVTVAVESSDAHSSTELAGLDAKSAADKALAGKGDDSDDEDGGKGGAAGADLFSKGGGSSDEEESEPPSPMAPQVTKAAGVKALPPPPPPTQLMAKAVEWHGMGAGTVRETRRLFALCCPCLDKSEQFQPLH